MKIKVTLRLSEETIAHCHHASHLLGHESDSMASSCKSVLLHGLTSLLGPTIRDIRPAAESLIAVSHQLNPASSLPSTILPNEREVAARILAAISGGHLTWEDNLTSEDPTIAEITKKLYEAKGESL